MKYCISVWGPKLWNDFLQNEEKEIQSYSLFQGTVKSKLIETENEIIYFWYYFSNFLFLILILLILISQNFKWESRSRAWWQGFFSCCKSFSLSTLLYKCYGYMLFFLKNLQDRVDIFLYFPYLTTTILYFFMMLWRIND